MLYVSLVTVAAFTAAGLSLAGVILNVILTARLTSGSKRQEWRRGYVLPIVADILFIEERFTFNIHKINYAKRSRATGDDWIEELRSMLEQRSKDVDEFDRKVITLQLTASPTIVHDALELSRYLHQEDPFGPVPDTGPEWLDQPRLIAQEDVQHLRDNLIKAMRRDMGLPS